MENKKIAKIFYEIADFLKMEGVQFKPYAYEKAASSLESLGENVRNIYKKKGEEGLKEIPGVGMSIAEKIEEYLKTGRIKYYEEFKDKNPINIGELAKVEGLGAQKTKALFQQLGVKSVKDLEKAALSHKIASLPGFGEKTEKNILQGIEFLKKDKGRFLLGEIIPFVGEIVGRIKTVKGVKKIDTAGSVRRMKETIGDIDILVASSAPQRVVDFFVSQPEVEKIWGKGSTKASVRAEEGFDIDLRVLPEKKYGSALQYFTGSKEHNISLRIIAGEKGMKLSEYGLFKGNKLIAAEKEEEIYKALGAQWIPPEIRENNGEIELALKKKLPGIVNYSEIRGDLHCHSNWDGGVNSISELAEKAKLLGYEYIGIADHTKFLKIEHGLDEKKLARRNKKIDEINKKIGGVRVLKTAETNILNDGSIDIENSSLKSMDFVIAGVHSNIKMGKRQMTERIIKAMKNPYVNIIAHPTGRLLKKRNAYQCDLGKVFRAAKELGVVLEINSSPQRLDLSDQNIKRAKEAGIKMCINTDAHHKDQMEYMNLGIGQARRGWAENKDIINTFSLEKLLKFFKCQKKNPQEQ